MDYSKLPLDRRNLERIIAVHPDEAVITKERCVSISENLIDKGILTKMPASLKDGKRIDKLDDRLIRLNEFNSNPMSKKVGFGLFGFSVFFYLIGGGVWVPLFAGILPANYLLILGYTIPKDKYIVFHRHNGILELPGAFYDKPHYIPFDDVPAFFAPNGFAGLFFFTLKVKRSFKIFRIKDFFPIDIDIFLKGGWQAWSYWVWYMDRNRPLPPGDAMDEFREADFQRRKAEGFPPPLYKSRIPTPEATFEQQVKREMYWRDEDYMV